MKNLISIAFLLFLFSCTKDIQTPPNVKLEASYLSNEALLLKGTTEEVCFRGFIISLEPGSEINAPNAATIGYDTGVGEFSRSIGLSRGEVWYVRAWAVREGEDMVGYSEEQSFLTW